MVYLMLFHVRSGFPHGSAASLISFGESSRTAVESSISCLAPISPVFSVHKNSILCQRRTIRNEIIGNDWCVCGNRKLGALRCAQCYDQVRPSTSPL